MAKVVKVSELQEISNRIFDHIKNVLDVEEVSITEDMYWNIHDKNLYQVDKSLGEDEIGIGQLSDDLDFLKSILEDSSNANPLSFIHLAPLLNYIATGVSWYEES